MYKLYKLFLIFFLLPFFSNAQANFKPAYIITVKGDTVHGFIDYREWDANPASINFKSQLIDNKVKSLGVNDIIYFNIINAEQFERYAGPISTDITETNHIGEGKDTSTKITTVFLKVLQKGRNISLYSYTDAVKARYFVKDKTEPKPTELIYRVYRENKQGLNDNTYLKQLFALAQKYNVFSDSFQWSIEHADYNSPDLLKITSQINGNSKTEKATQKSDAESFNLFVSAALSSTTIKASSDYKAAGGKDYTSALPALSFGINFFENPNTQKLVFRGELTVYGSHYKSLYNNQNTPYVPVNYSFNQLTIAFSPQILYNFYSSTSLKIYGAVGCSLTYYSYSNVIFGSQDGKTSGTNITENNPDGFSKYNTLVVIKAGVQFAKRWGIFADYITPAALSHDNYFQLNATTIQAGLAYYF